MAAVEAEASAAVEALAVEDRRVALEADRAPEALADRIIIPLTTITADISGDPAGAGVGDRAGVALIGAAALAEPLYF